MKAVILSSLALARSARAQLDAALGYPAAGVSADTGLAVPAVITTTTCEILEVVDWPSFGNTAYILPLTPDYEAIAATIGLVVETVDETLLGDVTVIGVKTTQRNSGTPTLAQVKAAKLSEVSASSSLRRSSGFLHTDGNKYSLEHNALRQIMEAKSWALYDQAHNTSYMTYPLVWPSVDRSGFIVMQNAEDVVSFALACSLADRTLTEQTASLEVAIAAASSVADVRAIIVNL